MRLLADLGAEDVALQLVGQEDRNDVGLLRGLRDRDRRETVLDGQVAVGRARQLGHDHRAAAVAEVLGVGMALRTVAENGNRLVLQQGKVRVFVVINLRRHRWILLVIGIMDADPGARMRKLGLSVTSPLPPDHGDASRAGHLDDPQGPHHFDEGLDFAFLSGDLDDHGLRGHVDDPAAEDFGQLGDFRPAARRGRDLDQHQVAFDVVLRADVIDADDGHDFFQLFPHLLQHAVVADDDEGHPRELGVFRLPHRQAIDVVAARGQHARNVRKHARHVLNQCGKHVTHCELPKSEEETIIVG